MADGHPNALRIDSEGPARHDDLHGGALDTPRVDRERRLTVEAAASLDFEPANLSEEDMPTNAELCRDGGMVCFFRIAFQLCRKSKAELIEMVADLESKGIHETTANGLNDAAEFFGEVARICKAADTRFLVAAAALQVQREGATA